MARRAPVDASELRGLARLAIDATLGLTDLVESMHGGIARPWAALRRRPPARTSGLTGAVYRSIRWTTRLAGAGADAALAAFGPAFDPALRGRPSRRREALVAALNGVLGDHLERTANPLAIAPQLRHEGRALPLADGALADGALAGAVPAARSRLVVMVHGLCRSDLLWERRGHDHGTALARDLGWTVLHARYNSGLHVSTNGRALAGLLEALVRSWPDPVEELAIVGHSMGGLVARSACHYAALARAEWPSRLRHLVFLGTPHHGAPLERGGRWLHRSVGALPFAGPLARLGSLRSAGITDLRHGSLLDEDWQDRDRFAAGADRRRHVPLPAAVRCGAVAATRARRRAPLHDRLVGDGLVPVDSALGRHGDPARSLHFPPERQRIVYGASHLDLLDSPEVYAHLRDWLDA